MRGPTDERYEYSLELPRHDVSAEVRPKHSACCPVVTGADTRVVRAVGFPWSLVTALTGATDAVGLRSVVTGATRLRVGVGVGASFSLVWSCCGRREPLRGHSAIRC